MSEDIPQYESANASRSLWFLLSGLYVLVVPTYQLVRTRGLLLWDYLKDFKKPLEGDELVLPFLGSKDSGLKLPLTPIVALLVSLVSLFFLLKAYGNYYQTQFQRLAIQRKLEGKVSKVGKTVTGLSEAMEANVQSSATNYTFFVVNSFFLVLWLLFSLTVFANMNVVYTYVLSTVLPAFLAWFVTAPKSEKKKLQ